MFFQILKREIRASHAKILSISLTEIPKTHKIYINYSYTMKIHIFAQLLNFQISEPRILDMGVF